MGGWRWQRAHPGTLKKQLVGLRVSLHSLSQNKRRCAQQVVRQQQSILDNRGSSSKKERGQSVVQSGKGSGGGAINRAHSQSVGTFSINRVIRRIGSPLSAHKETERETSQSGVGLPSRTGFQHQHGPIEGNNTQFIRSTPSPPHGTRHIESLSV